MNVKMKARAAKVHKNPVPARIVRSYIFAVKLITVVP